MMEQNADPRADGDLSLSRRDEEGTGIIAPETSKRTNAAKATSLFQTLVTFINYNRISRCGEKIIVLGIIQLHTAFSPLRPPRSDE